jgi:hypothetical protein
LLTYLNVEECDLGDEVFFSHSPIPPICHAPFFQYIADFISERRFSLTHRFSLYVTPHSSYIFPTLLL